MVDYSTLAGGEHRAEIVCGEMNPAAGVLLYLNSSFTTQVGMDEKTNCWIFPVIDLRPEPISSPHPCPNLFHIDTTLSPRRPRKLGSPNHLPRLPCQHHHLLGSRDRRCGYLDCACCRQWGSRLCSEMRSEEEGGCGLASSCLGCKSP